MRIAHINVRLYDLNGYGVRLHARVLRGFSERKEGVQPVVANPPTATQAIQQGAAVHQTDMFHALLMKEEQ